ncbi:MAG: ABC transporter ATP-binding protein [Actinomycetota bacterium]
MSSALDPPALLCTGVRKAFGNHTVLDGIDLEVDAGGITSILGPSGGGKTTLLRLVAGFDHADHGTISIYGQRVDGSGRPVPAHRRRIGCVPQEGALFPHLSIAANVGFGLPRGPGRATRVAECLDLVGLSGIDKARPHELSGGQQQRVALARALAPNPRLILLDEPFASLDAGLRSQVRTEVGDVLRHAGATAVLVTHDQEEALSISDSVAVLLEGRIRQHADPRTLYRAPVDLDVGRFVGEAIVLPGHIDDDTVECALGRLALHDRPTTRGEVSVLVRPEQIQLVHAHRGVAGRVVARAFLGAHATVDLDVDGNLAPIRARVEPDCLPEIGATVGVMVEGPAVAYPLHGPTSTDG